MQFVTRGMNPDSAIKRSGGSDRIPDCVRVERAKTHRRVVNGANLVPRQLSWSRKDVSGPTESDVTVAWGRV